MTMLLCSPAVIARNIWEARPHGERCVRAYNGALEAEPPAGSRGRETLVRCPEAKTLLAFGRSTKTTNFPFFYIWKRKKKSNICVVLAEMKFNKPQYVTDQCKLMKSNERHITILTDINKSAYRPRLHCQARYDAQWHDIIIMTLPYRACFLRLA